MGRNLFPCRPWRTFVASFCPPGFLVKRAKPADQFAIGQYKPATALHVAAIWCLDRRFDDCPDIFHRNRVRAESPDRTLGEDRLTQWHRQSGFCAHAGMLLIL